MTLIERRKHWAGTCPSLNFMNLEYASVDSRVIRIAQQFANTADSASLFIAGGTEKTRRWLLNAIGNRIIDANPSLRVRLFTAKEFVKLADDCRRKGRISEFTRNVLGLAICLVDGLEALGDDEDAQECFYLTIGAALEQGSRVALASQLAPNELGLCNPYYIQLLEIFKVANLANNDPMQAPELEAGTKAVM